MNYHPWQPLLPSPSVFPSIKVFSNESGLGIRWPKYWSFSFSSSPSNEYSGLIFFKIDWFDILAVQQSLKSLLQYHSLKASILCCSRLDTITHTMAMNLSKPQETVEDRGAWHAAVRGVSKSWMQLSNWTITTMNYQAMSLIFRNSRELIPQDAASGVTWKKQTRYFLILSGPLWRELVL